MQDVLVLRLVNEALIQVRGLIVPAPDKPPHDVKADALRLCLESHVHIPLLFFCFHVHLTPNAVQKISLDPCFRLSPLLY